jgi:hypothetical protein
LRVRRDALAFASLVREKVKSFDVPALAEVEGRPGVVAVGSGEWRVNSGWMASKSCKESGFSTP